MHKPIYEPEVRHIECVYEARQAHALLKRNLTAYFRPSIPEHQWKNTLVAVENRIVNGVLIYKLDFHKYGLPDFMSSADCLGVDFIASEKNGSGTLLLKKAAEIGTIEGKDALATNSINDKFWIKRKGFNKTQEDGLTCWKRIDELVQALETKYYS
ncbi:MAG: hypothetical protein Q8O89_06665 [Nanoarchaeota archaeon]|nr:hypothetical protein [Nanoarchaeota archaeon]